MKPTFVENKKKDKKPEEKPWHSQTVEEALRNAKGSTEGISQMEASRRLDEYGENVISHEEKEKWWELLLEQFKSLLIIILIAAAVLSAVVGETVEAIAIIIIVVLAGVLGFIQEYQAGNAIEALKKMAAPHAKVIRGGQIREIMAAKVVPGDLLVVDEGDSIVADARIVESFDLNVSEASLTGESHPVEKTSEPMEKESPLAERKNMLYTGTAVVSGRAHAVVVATADRTEFGKIAEMISGTESRRTPLQQNLDTLGQKIGIFSLILAALVSVGGLFRDHSILEMLVWGVALAVAIIPEALPAIVTIGLALGVRRMVKRKALIRKLPAVETLGSINIICSDKTGTLTQNQMTVKRMYVSKKIFDITGGGIKPEGEFKYNNETIRVWEQKDLRTALEIGALCNNSELHRRGDEWNIIGDPTEGALLVAAEKAEIDLEELKSISKRITEIPFSSDRKRMTTLVTHTGKNYAFTKGAPEIILERCNRIMVGRDEKELTEEDRQEIIKTAEKFGSNALRVIGLAYKLHDPTERDPDKVETGMVFAGLAGLIDPPHPQVRHAIDVCYDAGIKPIMITGDHKITAVAIAKDLNILRDGEVLESTEMEKMSDEEMFEASKKTQVYARISPEHKLKIVENLIKADNIVAMTGDGVNDAPALKKADIGVAMGIAGTDVSKEASDMILTDDNFTSIVAAVEEGRSIFENIRKYLVYILTDNMAAVFGMIYALAAGFHLPLVAVQILFINFIMDGVIAIALSIEPPEPGIMKRKPRNVKEGILSKPALWYISTISVWISVVSLAMFLWAVDNGYSEVESTTMFFATLIVARLINSMNCRSLSQSLFTMGFFKNWKLLLGIIFVLGMTLAVIYVDALQPAFNTAPLSQQDWIMIVIAASTVFVAGEIWKFIRTKILKV